MKKEEIKKITDELERGVKDLFESQKYMDFLRTMAKFHTYSFNNIMLIAMQKPEATLVAGYKTWQTKFGRFVKKGEKGITILAPCPHKATKLVVDANGNEEEREVKWMGFRATKVFDVSQTDGKELPEICTDLTGSVKGYDELMKELGIISPVVIGFEDIKGSAKGYFHLAEKRIAIQSGMSEMQTVKTAIHEIAHAILHDRENGTAKDVDSRTKEVQAESVAYTVCSVLGLDTTEYSFGYIAGWSEGKEVKELTSSMEIIRQTANQILEGLKVA